MTLYDWNAADKKIITYDFITLPDGGEVRRYTSPSGEIWYRIQPVGGTVREERFLMLLDMIFNSYKKEKLVGQRTVELRDRDSRPRQTPSTAPYRRGSQRPS